MADTKGKKAVMEVVGQGLKTVDNSRAVKESSERYTAQFWDNGVLLKNMVNECISGNNGVQQL